MLSVKPVPTPEIQISSDCLDFGIFNPALEASELPTAQLAITNTGTGTLAGRIIPQVSWVKVSPTNFRLNSGESSQHTVHLEPQTPSSWQTKPYYVDFLLLINSNAGTKIVAGTYQVQIQKQSQGGSFTWIWVVIPLFILIASIVFVFSQISSSSPDHFITQSVQMLYTQGAATVLAKLTLTPPFPGIRLAQTPSPVAIITLSSLETIPQATPTLTPWQRDAYPNPEQFIRDYYNALNNRKYERAWTMLSPKFQSSCCSIAGNDPFVVYSNWWNTIEKVEVLTAYLQDWNANPAPVYVTLRYVTRKGNVLETFNVFYLIADPVRKTLLIDQVK
ncbi:MAG: hypothetical protein WHV66_12355 [Anaerolineales bacterium]